ncbi:MAG: CvpA family protein [Planctomycetota bacterium]
MVLSLIAIALTAGIAYAWVTRGFFSALLHMVCVIAAGAIAFGFWETASLAIIDKAPEGFFAFAKDAAWGIGLIAPFIVSLAILRFITDSLVKVNAEVEDAFNYVGGGVCGLVSGVISAGIFINAISFMRMPVALFGHQPVTFGTAGNFQATSNLIVPVDRLTATFYNHLSQNVLSTSTPLALYYPDLPAAAGAQRMSDGNGSNRNSVSTDAVVLAGAFTVGKQAGGPGEVLDDFNSPNGPQQVSGLDGNPISNPYLVGYVVNFQSGARESFGQIVFSKGQARLVSQNEAGEALTSFPIAVSSQARAGEDTFGRYRFDTEGTHIASVGGAAEAPMAIEFAIPRGHEPVALYVKNVRLDVGGVSATAYADAAARDLDIRTGNLLGGTRADDLDLGNATIAESPNTGRPAGFTLATRLPRAYRLQEGATRGIGINEDNQIVSGTQAFAPNEAKNRVTRELAVDEFFVTSDTAIVQITLTGSPSEIPSSVFGPAAVAIDNTQAPRLVDSTGRVYPAVGYVYEDRDKVEIRYSPSDPLSAMNDAPGLSGTRDDQTMIMIFRVSVGVEIEHFAIGDTVVTTYDGPVSVTRF